MEKKKKIKVIKKRKIWFFYKILNLKYLFFSLFLFCSFCHASTRNEPTRGNRRVPLSETQFPRLHQRVHKANDDKFIPNLVNLPRYVIIYYTKKISYRKFGRTPFKIRLSPCPRKIVYIIYIPPIENHQLNISKTNNIIHRPNSYVGG